MTHKILKDDFQKIVLVICKGSEDREEYEFCMNEMFEITGDQRNYYWESYCEAKGILDALNFLGKAKLSLSTEHPKDIFPDNVSPIK